MTSKGARFSPGRFPGAFVQAAAGVLQCTGGEGWCVLPAPATREDERVNRRQVLEVLSRSKPELRARFALSRLALFGSFARDTADDDSDVDVIVEFDGIPTPDRGFGVQFYL